MAVQGCANAGLCAKAETWFGAEGNGGQTRQQRLMPSMHRFGPSGLGLVMVVVVKSPMTSTSHFLVGLWSDFASLLICRRHADSRPSCGKHAMN